jgi:hypothetical protein
MSELELEQCMTIKFLIKPGKTGTEIWEMLGQVYRNSALKEQPFSEDREDVIDDERSGWPSTSRNVENIQKVQETVQADSRLTVRGIAHTVQIDRETVTKFLTVDLCVRKVYAKMVPK